MKKGGKSIKKGIQGVSKKDKKGSKKGYKEYQKRDTRSIKKGQKSIKKEGKKRARKNWNAPKEVDINKKGDKKNKTYFSCSILLILKNIFYTTHF